MRSMTLRPLFRKSVGVSRYLTIEEFYYPLVSRRRAVEARCSRALRCAVEAIGSRPWILQF